MPYKLYDETALRLEQWLYSQGFKKGDFSIIHKDNGGFFENPRQVFFRQDLYPIKKEIWNKIKKLGYN